MPDNYNDNHFSNDDDRDDNPFVDDSVCEYDDHDHERRVEATRRYPSISKPEAKHGTLECSQYICGYVFFFF